MGAESPGAGPVNTPINTPVNTLALMLTGGPPPASSRTLGFLNARTEGETVVLEYRPGEAVLNPLGTVQGGFVAAILDDVFSVAILSVLGADYAAPTIEMKVSYFKPVLPGLVRGVGRVLQQGRNIAFVESELRDADGMLLAKASATTAIRRRPPAPAG